jgi:hypothetical protein
MKHDLNELKQLVAEFGVTLKRGNELLGRIYLYTYQWVNEAIRTGTMKNRTSAIHAVAKSTGRTHACIVSWDACGRHMEENNLGVGVDPRGVRLLASYALKTPPDAKFKMISQIRKGTPFATIYREWKANPSLMRNETHRRLARLMKEGRLTKQYLKIEMLALLTAAKKVLDKEVLSICIADEDFTPLLEVGNKLTLA